jgi:hypothetical protein
MHMPQTDPFRKIADAAYSRYVPIIPHDAVLSPLSSLSQRTGNSDPRGKAPGCILHDGKWGSYDWLRHILSTTTLQTLAAAGAGVGVIAGDQGDGTSLFFIDADTLDEDLARRILDIFVEVFGFSPDIRIGRAPKFLMPVRCKASMPYMRVEFAGKDGKPERVEMLSDGRQAVFLGIHPITGQPYVWVRGLPHYHEIPFVEAEDILRFFGRLRRELPEASKVITEGATNIPVQESLKAPLDIVRRAVALLPNTTDAFPSREDYLHVGYAIKAALPDHPDDALELYLQWCGRWQDPSGRANDPAVAERDWKRMKPPFKVGAPWLFDQLDRITGNGTGSQLAVESVFSPIEAEPDNPFTLAPPTTTKTKHFQTYSIEELEALPPARYLIKRYIPTASTTILFGKYGTFKSFITLDMALAIAHRLPDWHGMKIDAGENPSVLYIAAEGAPGVLARVRAWRKKNAVPLDGKPVNFRVMRDACNFLDAEDVTRLMETIKALPGFGNFTLIVMDTLSRAIPGADENLQKDMSMLASSCDRLSVAFGCAVLAVHHANAQGNIRGGTNIPADAAAVFKVTRQGSKKIIGLFAEKLKDDEDKWTDTYTMDQVEIGRDEDGKPISSLVPRLLVRGEAGDSVGTGPLEQDVLSAVAEAATKGLHWAKGFNSPRSAARRMMSLFGMERGQAEELLGRLEAEGLIELAIVDKRAKTKGYVTIGDETGGPDPDNLSIFD